MSISVLVPAPSALLASLLATSPSPEAVAEPAPDADIEPASEDEASSDFGPFFEGEPASDVQYPGPMRPAENPPLSIGQGGFCFVESSHCRASLLLSADIGAGIRAPASDEGPDIPYAQFTFRGGFTIRPAMIRPRRRKAWHAWGVGAVSSWSRGTGSITYEGSGQEQEEVSTDSTTVFRIGMINQLWLSQRKHAPHLDFTIGAAQSDVLTSGVRLWGTHAEAAMGFGGWGGMFLSGDFLDGDTRVVLGFRGHGIAAAPIVAMALAGLALGGAL